VYGEPATRPSRTLLELVLFEKIAYLSDDRRREQAFHELQTRVGTRAHQILAASSDAACASASVPAPVPESIARPSPLGATKERSCSRTVSICRCACSATRSAVAPTRAWVAAQLPDLIADSRLTWAFVIALATRESSLTLKMLAWSLFVFETLLVLSARTHYTIDILGGITELIRLHQSNAAEVLTRGTGGATFPFTREKALVQSIKDFETWAETNHSKHLQKKQRPVWECCQRAAKPRGQAEASVGSYEQARKLCSSAAREVLAALQHPPPDGGSGLHPLSFTSLPIS